MKEPSITKYTNEDIVSLIRDVIDIFSDSREELRNTDQEIIKSIEQLNVSQNELREEIRAARYESKMADEEIKDELRSFKYEMRVFQTETNATLKQHGVYFKNIQQDIVLLGGLEARVSRLEKVRS